MSKHSWPRLTQTPAFPMGGLQEPGVLIQEPTHSAPPGAIQGVHSDKGCDSVCTRGHAGTAVAINKPAVNESRGYGRGRHGRGAGFCICWM